MNRLSIIIPAFNEEDYIATLVERVLAVDLSKLGIVKELVIVDDGSKDGTLAALEPYRGRTDIQILSHPVNQGKGAALATGFAKANGDIILVQDADLEYDPSEYAKLLTPILDGRADVVFGSRFVGGEAHRVLYFWHSIGNKALTLLSNIFSDLNLTDMETCYKAFRTDIVRTFTLREKRFGFEAEITAKLARLSRNGSCRIFEVGISYSGRTYAEGKKIGWKDGISALRCILKYNLFQ